MKLSWNLGAVAEEEALPLHLGMSASSLVHQSHTFMEQSDLRVASCMAKFAQTRTWFCDGREGETACTIDNSCPTLTRDSRHQACEYGSPFAGSLNRMSLHHEEQRSASVGRPGAGNRPPVFKWLLWSCSFPEDSFGEPRVRIPSK